MADQRSTRPTQSSDEKPVTPSPTPSPTRAEAATSITSAGIHETALSLVNDIKVSLAHLARAIAEAAKDGKVTPSEGLALGMQGLTLASTIISTIEGRDAQLQQDIVWVLENAVFTVPSEG